MSATVVIFLLIVMVASFAQFQASEHLEKARSSHLAETISRADDFLFVFYALCLMEVIQAAAETV